MLEVCGLTKAYGSLVAARDVSFSIPKGVCFGLLGPNGAGKTTTISMVSGIVEPDAGTVSLGGKPVASVKREIGYVPQEVALYDDLDANSNLEFFGALYGLSGKVLQHGMARALEIAGLTDRAKDRVKTYSGGMKRRLNIAVSLLHRPSLLILDEPTVGVDPQSRNAIFEVLEALLSEGSTLLYTTHYMEEAERLCKRVAIMDHGVVIAEDDVAELHRKVAATNRVEVNIAAPSSWTLLPPAGLVAQRDDDLLTIEVKDMSGDLARIFDWLHREGVEVTGVRSHRASLEEVFLHLTGRSLRD